MRYQSPSPPPPHPIRAAAAAAAVAVRTERELLHKAKESGGIQRRRIDWPGVAGFRNRVPSYPRVSPPRQRQRSVAASLFRPFVFYRTVKITSSVRQLETYRVYWTVHK